MKEIYRIIYLFWVNILLSSAIRDDENENEVRVSNACAADAIRNRLPAPETLCCGVNISDLDDSYSDGVSKVIDMFPWSVFLISNFVPNEIYSCDGALITSHHVLTAARCVHRPGVRLEKVEVMNSKYEKRSCELRTMSDNPFETIPYCISKMDVDDVIVHEDFVYDKLVNDIALVKLRSQPPTRYVAPVCLPPFNIDEKHLMDEILVVTKWLTASNYREALDFDIYEDDFVRQANLVFHVSHNECLSKYFPVLNQTQICAVSHSKERIPEGNSGSPLMMLYKGSYYLIGLFNSMDYTTLDGKVAPSLFTNVYLYLPWIKKNVL